MNFIKNNIVVITIVVIVGLFVSIPIIGEAIDTRTLDNKLMGFFTGYMGAGEIYVSKGGQECAIKTYRKYMDNTKIRMHVEEGRGLYAVLGQRVADKLADELAFCVLDN